MPRWPPHAHLVDAEEDAHEQRRAVDHRRVDDLSFTRHASFHQRRENAHDEEESTAAEVGDQVERWNRRPARLPDVVEHTGERDVVEVVTDVAGQRAVLSPARHPAVHEARVVGEQRVGSDAEPFGDARSKALHEHVGPLAEAQHHIGGAGSLRSIPAERRPRSRIECSVTGPWRPTPVSTCALRSSRSTSAPRSESSIPANWSGPMFGSSSTLIPCSGPVMGCNLRACRRHPPPSDTPVPRGRWSVASGRATARRRELARGRRRA